MARSRVTPPEPRPITGEARAVADRLTALIDEQAALRRVATAVAADQPVEAVVELVIAESARLLDADLCVGSRIEGERFHVIGSRAGARDDDLFPVGAEHDLLPGSAIEAAVRTGVAVVVEDLSTAAWQGRLRARGYRGCAIAPIVVGGRVWGVISIAYREPKPDMALIGRRLEDFIELVSLGVRAADARRIDEARDRLASMLEWSDSVIMAVDERGVVTAWNRAAEALLGWSSQEMIGAPIEPIVPASRRHELEVLPRVFTEGLSVPAFETERLHKDGRVIEVSLSLAPLRDGDGRVVGVSATGQGLDAQRRSEAATARLAAVVEQSHEALAAFDTDGRVTEWNKAAERLFGYAAEDVLGRPVSLLADGRAVAEQEALLRRVLGGEALRYEGLRRRKDGVVIEVELSTAPVRDARGRIRGASIVARDLREIRRSLREREAAAERAVLLADAARVIAEAPNAEAAVRGVVEVLRGALADWVRIALADGHAHGAGDDGWPLADALAAAVWSSGRAVTADAAEGAGAAPEAEALLAAGAAAVLGVPMKARRGALGAMVLGRTGCGFDLEEQRLVEDVADRLGRALENAELHAAVRAAEQRFRAAFEHAPVGMALVRLDEHGRGTTVELNQALCDITGHDRETLLARDASSLVHPDDRAVETEGIADLLAGRVSHFGADLRLVHASGHSVDVQVRGAAVAGGEAGPVHIICQVQDISERLVYENELQYLADHDHMTGLFNRRRFLTELDREVAQVRRYGFPSTLLIVDVDNFKYINDNYGHAVGDELLTGLAELLRRRLRVTDTVARLGGDEFAVLLSHTSPGEARRTADALLADMRAQVMVQVGGRIVRCTASVGLRGIEPDARLTAEELLVEADVAMYDAKEAGRDRTSIGGGASEHLNRMRSRLTWSERIRDALEQDAFALVEQPILGLRSGQVERSEVLVRMLDDDGGLIPPSVFLPVAERFGQIQAIDRWVIRNTIELLARRQADGLDLGIEVNLSGLSISDQDVMDFIAAEVRNAGIDPTGLTFEVTETAAIENITRVRALARRLSDLGCQFALDDFGSGFGSFYYLKHLPFDLVKIDGDFIKDLPQNRTDQLTVQAIVQIARGLGNATVAEFVQDADAVALLRSFGVDLAQGFHVGMPQPVELRPAFPSPA